MRGKISGGQQPVSGATVQLYAATSGGPGSAATPLLHSTVLSDAAGNFSITGLYSCPDRNSLVYLTATGGNPGLAAGTNNHALALAAALGYCGDLTPQTYISVNELTTVAAVMALSPFMSSVGGLGYSAPDLPSLIAGFSKAQMYVDTTSGTSPGPSLPTGYAAPTAQLATLADAIASCVNSTGGAPGDGSACGTLFVAATPAGGPPPTDTVGALIQIALSPTMNVIPIFNLVASNGPFQPTLTSPPVSWALSVQPPGSPGIPERVHLIGEYLLDEGVGLVAHDTSGAGNDASINGPVWEGDLDLNFNATGEYIQLPSSLNATKTWQFAIYNPPFGNNDYPLPPGYGIPADFGFNSTLLAGTDDQHLTLGANSIGGKSFRFFALRTDETEASDFFPPGWHVFTMVCGSNSGTVTSKTHYLYDGVEVSSYVQQGDSSTCGNPISGNYQIGGSSFYPYGTWFVGKIAAAWAWNSPLTVTEAGMAGQAALEFIRSKGIPQSYRKANVTSPLIVAGLDSRTEGDGLNPDQAWPALLTLTDPSYNAQNLGIIGQLSLDACQQFDLTYGALLTGAYPAIVMLWGGVNDTLFSNQTAQQIADNLKCMVQKAKAAGARVILATEISSSSSSSPKGDAMKNSLDPVIRAEAASWGADNIADLAESPILGADGASSNTVCFQDTVHPTAYCQMVIATLMSNSVNELLGSTATAPHMTRTNSYQEEAGDRFLQLSGSGNQTITLPSCVGYSLSRRITNLGINPATVLTSNHETLTGASIVPVGSATSFAPLPGPLATGGCGWVGQ